MGEETPIEKLFKLMDKNGDGYVSRKARKLQKICMKVLLKLWIYKIQNPYLGIPTNL